MIKKACLPIFNYLLAVFVLSAVAFVVFRVRVLHDYRGLARLSPLSSILELVVFGLFFCFPYLYNPPNWAWFWLPAEAVSRTTWAAGLVLIITGMAAAFGTMAWFGLRRALGMRVNGLVTRGPYRLTRNPQVVSGYLMVIGVALLRPSWYAMGWVALYGLITHWMILSEEELMKKVFGNEYVRYCRQAPRYLGHHLKQPQIR